MKKISWSAIVIGFLTGLGAAVVGVIILFIFLGGLGVEHLGPLSKVLVIALAMCVTVIQGYITARLSRPNGMFNACILGCCLTLLHVLGGFGGWNWVRILLPIPLCLFGSMFVKTR